MVDDTHALLAYICGLGSGLLLCILALAPPGAQAQLTQRVLTTKATQVNAVYAAQLGGDTNRDVVFASRDTIAWMENKLDDGNGFGAVQVINGSAGTPLTVYSTDLNGDNRNDVIAGSNNAVVWYENKGNGRFSSANTIGNFSPSSVYAAPIDDDNDFDIVACAFGSGKVVWFENNIAEGNGFGAEQVISSSADGAQSVHADYLDGDGQIDILSASQNDGTIAWYENRLDSGGGGSDGFSDAKKITTTAQSPQSVYAARIDGDNAVDVLASSSDGGTVAWYKNKIRTSDPSSDGFGTAQPIVDNAQSPDEVYAADLNRDDNPDVITTPDQKVAWHENAIGEGVSNTGFSSEKLISDEVDVTTSVHATDLDGDSDLDVISASFEDDKVAWYENTSTTLPVELTTFDARLDGQAVTLTWRTASEQGNAGFAVQRTTPTAASTQWTKVGYREGAGTTNAPQSYSLTDDRVPVEADSLTYRLKQIDTDGSTTFSDPITVGRSVDGIQLRGTSPNPARTRTTVHYTVPTRQQVTIRLFDVLGREMRTVARSTASGRHEQPVSVDRLQPGIYFLRLQAGGHTRTQKLTVVR